MLRVDSTEAFDVVGNVTEGKFVHVVEHGKLFSDGSIHSNFVHDVIRRQ